MNDSKIKTIECRCVVLWHVAIMRYILSLVPVIVPVLLLV